MNQSNHNDAERVEHESVKYERRDISVRALVFVGIGFIMTAIILHFGIWRVYGYFAARDLRTDLQPSTLIRTDQMRWPPEPRLQTNPEGDLEEMQRAQNGALNEYGWINKEAGVVKIPIERAIDLTAQRGLQANSYIKSESEQPTQSPGGESVAPEAPSSGRTSEKPQP